MSWWLILLFVFAIPWEYSLDLGAPFGNVARVAGLAALLMGLLALLRQGWIRAFCPIHFAVLAYFFCHALSCIWSIDPVFSFTRLRGYAQEIMIVFLAWEFAERTVDLRAMLRSYLLGCWVLAILSFAARSTIDPETQIRLAAFGQDPNDAARYLAFGLPIAVFLSIADPSRILRRLSLLYLAAGFIAIVLSGSRSGFVLALTALLGSGFMLGERRRSGWGLAAAGFGTIAILAVLSAQSETLTRIASIVEQLQHGDLNQRLRIWNAGWHAFARAPLIGHGTGSFVQAVGVAPMDTAHNTILSVAISTGICGVLLGSIVVVVALWMSTKLSGLLRLLMTTLLLVWLLSSTVATVEESRSSWFLLALVVVAARLNHEQPDELSACFAGQQRQMLPLNVTV